MLVSLASLLLLCVPAAGLEADVAPDQPLRYVYVDEPVIIELRADEAIDTAVQLSVESPALESSQTYTLPKRSFPAGSTYWWPVEKVPEARGFYKAHLTADALGDWSADLTFCRIDRPGGSFPLPLCVGLDEADPRVFLALDALSLERVRIAGGGEEAYALADAVRSHGAELIVLLPAEDTAAAAANAKAWAERFGDGVLRWDLRAPFAAGAARVAGTLKDTGVPGDIALAVPDVEALTTLLEAGGVQGVSGVVLESGDTDPAAIERARALLARAGLESWQIHARLPAALSAHDAFPRALVAHYAAGADSVLIDNEQLLNPDPAPAFAYLNGLDDVFRMHQFAGPVPVGKGNTALLFREGAAWQIALWSTGKEAENVRLNLGEATALTLQDAMRNDLPAPALEEGAAVLAPRAMVRVLTGKGGSLLLDVAEARAASLAGRFAQDRTYNAELWPELMEHVGAVAARASNRRDRERFLTLLRFLPRIETARNAGSIPAETAFAASADLMAIMRALCVVQESTGERFHAPLPERLASCKEAGRVFLSAAEVAPRITAMVQEVNMLAAQAQRLHDDGRLVEADAVAALAEWRARAIEQAAADPAEASATQLAALDTALPESTPAENAEVEHAAVTIEENVDTSTPPAQPDAEPEAQAENAPEPRTLTHTVARGESASVIAGKYDVGLSDLLAWNNLTRRSVLNIGDALIIHLDGETEEAQPVPAAEPVPAPAQEPAPEPALEPAPEAEPVPEVTAPESKTQEEENPAEPTSARRTHVVARGDNMSNIAKKYGVDLDDLLRWNKLTRRSTLSIGDELVIEGGTESPAPASPEAPSAPEERIHTVARGENPSIIADKYGVDLDALLEWNQLTRRSTLNIGDKLAIRGGKSTGASDATAERTITHTVVRGDNPSVIANKYNVPLEDFLQWNKLNKRSILQVGDQYVVYLPAQ